MKNQCRHNDNPSTCPKCRRHQQATGPVSEAAPASEADQLRILAETRAIIGDSRGRLTQDQLLDLIRQRFDPELTRQCITCALIKYLQYVQNPPELLDQPSIDFARRGYLLYRHDPAYYQQVTTLSNAIFTALNHPRKFLEAFENDTLPAASPEPADTGLAPVERPFNSSPAPQSESEASESHKSFTKG